MMALMVAMQYAAVFAVLVASLWVVLLRPESFGSSHLPGCGYHPDAKPESWDPVVGAGCLCPEPDEDEE
jgi:hypothetical protein